jgi:hypothetical protein
MSVPHVLTLAEVEAAADEWGCNCGLAALAAVLGLSLAEIRPHLGDFEAKGYMNPTMMLAALRSLGVKWEVREHLWPSHGLCRVQWEGPWTAPGVPMRARYRHTHWVGAREVPANPVNGGALEVFDVNAMHHNGGWIDFEVWRQRLVPWILKHAHPKASGAWHLTHRLQIVSGGAA